MIVIISQSKYKMQLKITKTEFYPLFYSSIFVLP